MMEDCTCPCHNPKQIILHIAPCCHTCEQCGRHILFAYWGEHATKCQHIAVDAEGLLIEALSFYADPVNWEGDCAKVSLDNGAIARQALAEVERSYQWMLF